MVTAGTYQKIHLFNTEEKLSLLQEKLLNLALKYGWHLNAWAIFSNHYHFIAQSPKDPKNLPIFLAELHFATSTLINKIDQIQGRKVWFQYWDSHITYQRSYFARLNYVNSNPVKHGLVQKSSSYPWCSARWFENIANPSFRKTIESFETSKVKVIDDF